MRLNTGKIALTVAVLVTTVHTALRLTTERQATFQAGKWIDVAIGSSPDIEVRQSGEELSLQLSQIAPGRCVYLVIASATCGASRAEMTKWVIDLGEGRIEKDRPGWHVAWFIAGDSQAVAKFVDPQFAVPTYVADDWLAAVASLRVRAYPAHLVLDRTGRVMEAEIGATLPSSKSLRSDCTLGNHTG